MNLVPIVGASAFGVLGGFVLLFLLPLCVLEFCFQLKQVKKTRARLLPPYHTLYRIVRFAVSLLVVVMAIISVIASTVDRISAGQNAILAVLISLFALVVGSVLFLGVVLALSDLMFLPYLIAHSRGHRNETAILIMTFLGSWTIILWIAALIWAFTNPAPVTAQQVSNADELKKYKNFLDEGVITQEEFEEKKKNLLDR